MYDSRKNRSEFQVKKVSIIHSVDNTNYSDNNTSIINVVNGGFDTCNSQVGELGRGDKSYLRRITISRKKKRRRLFGGIIPNKKSMPSIAAAACSFLPSSNSSSEASSPTSQAENTTIGILVADTEEMNPRSAAPSHGLISVVGRRRSMEDAITVVPSLVHVSTPSTTFDFFAVYDGHGGYEVASRCKERLHHLVAAEITADMERAPAGEVDWARVMTSSFARMDEEVAEDVTEDHPAATVGSTALVVVVGKEEVVVANCGDCRAVLGTGGGAALPLSRDHKPERPDEKERVEAAGGNVVNWDCSRVLGVLATSRSIGDYYLKPYVTSEPEVTVHKRTLSDEFLVIASDGLWDVVSNELACELVRKCFCGQVKKKVYDEYNGSCAAAAAAMLAELAIARGSWDNISVIVVELQPLSASSTSTSTSATSSP